MLINNLKSGANGQVVKNIQEALIFLGYDLPKYGADGYIGLETLDAIEDFSEDHNHNLNEGWNDSSAASGAVVTKILDCFEAGCMLDMARSQDTSGVDLIDITNDHPRAALKGTRPWINVTGITLHQTGIMMNNTPTRFQRLKAHIGILKKKNPTIVQVYPLNAYLYHANLFNKTDVGIEINGCFEGIDGKTNTAWKGGYTGVPDRATHQQITACRAAVKLIINRVATHGGKITEIHAHRQTSKNRRSDPGSLVWKNVGVWAQQTLGLSDGGDGYTLKDGFPIPKEWDNDRTGVY